MIKKILIISIALFALIAFSASQVTASSNSIKFYQMEKGKMLNNAKSMALPGLSGGRAVFMIGSYPSVAVTLNESKASLYTLKLRYSKPVGISTDLGVYLNGKWKKKITIPATGSLATWRNFSFELSLPNGKSTLLLKKSTKPDSIALDYVSTTLAPLKQTVDISFYEKYQTIEGFGSFGAKYNYWENAPGNTYYDNAFVNLMVNNMGLTVTRIELTPDFEPSNDNSDPNSTNNSGFSTSGNYARFIPYIKAYIGAGSTKVIATVWSPPAWMKTNNSTVNGGSLRIDMYEEFAEFLSTYSKFFKRDTGVDLFGISLQNELEFVETYNSCVYTFSEYADLMKVVGERFKKDGITTKIFGPEGMLSSVGNSTMNYIYYMNDNNSIQYLSAIAVHGYSNGVDADSPAPALWESDSSVAKEFNKQIWMTETSGYTHDWASTMGVDSNGNAVVQTPGAFQGAQDIYCALKYGKISLWTWWASSDRTFSVYSLTANGVPGKKVWASKQFFRYIRPGAVQVGSSSKINDIKVIAFKNASENTATIVLLNTGSIARQFEISTRAGSLPKSFKMYRTSSTEDCLDVGTTSTSVNIPAQSIMTLYGTY